MENAALDRLKEKGYIVLHNVMGEFILYYKGTVVHTDKNLANFLDFVEKYEEGLDSNEGVSTQDEG